MTKSGGLRDRKKAQTRERIADAAAALFAERGYDAVTMFDVAMASDVSDQTVYNYFSAKQDLVLDRAEQFREMYRDAVRQRRPGCSPAAALGPLVEADIERYRHTDLDLARGQFPAQSVESGVLRRFTLEERERQVEVMTEAVVATTPELAKVVALSHCAAIVAVIQAIYDQIGSSVLDRSPQNASADDMLRTLDVAFSSLDRTFSDVLSTTETSK
ncbi:TetR family transcriptional regulator [Rhodococcoides trifolii]|uniref:TetR family transcriptional regulator n=1 Tax=Rhodococcoides trifolii TaxID=908250 RepID=A0A917FUB7_9NOCA|nr:TetR/AcrR family transcriptional regulator [Rhodococcus trifolii]GGG03471.1 TetR family transcriptional regulator [Rhodococcus trifolii]